jgi:ABC-type polar amino acid transport system ATPase subunit
MSDQDYMIQVREISKRFDSLEVLRRVSLNVRSGEVFVVVGPSGGGKSTLLRCLCHLETPDEGEILMAGRRIDRTGASPGQIGMVFQQFNLFPHLTALENITLAPRLVRKLDRRAAEDRARALLQKMGLQDKVNARPRQLSGGQQQRLAIARTLMQEPEVILADEPVASLDPVLSNEILELLIRLTEEAKLTLLTSLHQVDLALRHSKRIVGLRCGEIAFDAPTKDLDQRSLTHLYRSARERDAAPDNAPLEESGGASHGAESDQKRACIR